MNTRVYSILDVKARAFGALLFFANDDMCYRAMAQPLQEGSDVARWPEDFVMYQVGEFDTDNGVLVGVAPRVLGTFAEYHKKG